MISGWRETVERAWYEGAWWLWLLRPLEVIFRLLAAARRVLYQKGCLAVYRPAVPVVVVGNITVGGTGKTPVIVALVEYLQQQGIRVGVVSRGYGAVHLRAALRVASDCTARDCGDEPLLIYQRTGCPCVVAPSRAEAVRELLRSNELDLVLSDDGLQHYALGRDMEIAVLDDARRIGNGFCLPAGPLREPKARLRSVDCVLYRGSNDLDNGVLYRPESLHNLATGDSCPPAPALLGKAVYAIAGIAQPGQFLAGLRSLGFELEPRLFEDHHGYTSHDFAGLANKPIIMTEKDAVKCAGLVGDNAWYLKVSAQLPAKVTDTIVALVRP